MLRFQKLQSMVIIGGYTIRHIEPSLERERAECTMCGAFEFKDFFKRWEIGKKCFSLEGVWDWIRYG